MVFQKRNVLTKLQCNFIINTALSKELNKASVRNNEGESYYDEMKRGGRTTFLEKQDLPGAWEKIIGILSDINSNCFKAVIDSYGFQFAEYNEGEVGFGWHHDDAMYPTKHTYWGGRKLTAVFELSDNNDYEGGLLEVNPYNCASPNDNQERRALGDCVVFPAFFKHRVTPITKGKRYSLTVWCKGPVWV